MSLDYTDPSLRPSRDATAAWRSCASCGDEFPVTHGEVTFAREAGIELPTLCRWHRPTRREALAAQRQQADPWYTRRGSRRRRRRPNRAGSSRWPSSAKRDFFVGG